MSTHENVRTWWSSIQSPYARPHASRRAENPSRMVCQIRKSPPQIRLCNGVVFLFPGTMPISVWCWPTAIELYAYKTAKVGREKDRETQNAVAPGPLGLRGLGSPLNLDLTPPPLTEFLGPFWVKEGTFDLFSTVPPSLANLQAPLPEWAIKCLIT